MAKRIRAQLEDELRTLFVCPVALHQKQQQCFTGTGELLAKLACSSPSEDKAGQLYELQQHLRDPTLFGPRITRAKEKLVTEAQLHALLISNTSRSPGFHNILQYRNKPQAESQADAKKKPGQQKPQSNTPLLRLLRRVALWWYYRVMFDPLDQLVALSSSYELLFQLMTPHQQLSCMADILLVLVCPVLDDKIGQLDTPLHTATLLSMLKMAQQLAMREARVAHLQMKWKTFQKLQAAGQLNEQQLSRLDATLNDEVPDVSTAAQFILPSAPALLRAAREVNLHLQGTSAHEPITLADRDRNVEVLLRQLQSEAQQQQQKGQWSMVATWEGLLSLRQTHTCQAIGALIAQLSQLPPKQFDHWWHSHLTEAHGGLEVSPAAEVAKLLQDCCSGLQVQKPLQLDGTTGEDPVLQLVLWLMSAMDQNAQRQQQQQQQEGSKQPGQQQQQQQGHPAEALRQLVDVLLSALQYRHTLSMREWKLAEDRQQGQQQLLRALHCHCMQLLTQARDHLQPEACTAGGGQAGDGAASTLDQQQQQRQRQRQVWQQCVQQVQHNVLLVLQLTTHWQDGNKVSAFQDTYFEYHSRLQAGTVPGFLPRFLRPEPRPQSTLKQAAAAFWQPTPAQSLEQQQFDLFVHLLAIRRLAAHINPQIKQQDLAAVSNWAEAASTAAAGAAVEAPMYASLQRGFLGSWNRGQRQQQQQQPTQRAPQPAAVAAADSAQLLQSASAVAGQLTQLADDVYDGQLQAFEPYRPLDEAPISPGVSALMQQLRCNNPQQLCNAVTAVLVALMHFERGAALPSKPPQKAKPLSGAHTVGLMRRLLAHLDAPAPLTDTLLEAWQRINNLEALAELECRMQQQLQSLKQQHSSVQLAGQGFASQLPALDVFMGGFGKGHGNQAQGFDMGPHEDFDSDPLDGYDDVLRMKGGRGGSSTAASDDGGCAPGYDAQQQHHQQQQQQQYGWPSASLVLGGGKGGSSTSSSQAGAASNQEQQPATHVPMLQRLQQRRPQQQQQQQQHSLRKAVAVVVDDDSSCSEAGSPTAASAAAAAASAVAAAAAAAAGAEASDVVGDHSDAGSDVVVAVAGRRSQGDFLSSSGVQQQQQVQQQAQQQAQQQQRRGMHAAAAAAAAEFAHDDSLAPGLDVLTSAAAADSSSWQSEFQQQQQQRHQYGQQEGHFAETGCHGSGSEQFTDADEASAPSEHMHDVFSDADMLAAEEMWHNQQQQQPVGLSALQDWASLGQLRQGPLARKRAAVTTTADAAAAAAAAESEVGSDERHWCEEDGVCHSYSPDQGSAAGSPVSSPRARQVFGEGYQSFRDWEEAERQQAWDSAADQHSGGSSRMRPGFMGLVENVQLFWEDHLSEQKQQRKQGSQPAGQQQQQQVLSTAEVQSYQPSHQLREQLGPQTQLEAVVAWLELLCAAVSGSSAVRGHVMRLLQTVAELDPDICDERDSYYWLDSGEVLKALRQPALLAYLSVALTGQLAEAYLDRNDGQLAAELTDKLWVAVDSAYSTVILEVNKLSGSLEGWEATLQEDLVQPLRKAQDQWGQTRRTRVPCKQKGFPAITEAMAQWVELVTDQLEALGPVPVVLFEPAKVDDELAKGETSETVAKLELWHNVLVATLDVVKRLVKAQTWLAHTGRTMQVTHKLLRRTERALAGNHGDPVLSGLHAFVVTAKLPELTKALFAAVEAHKHVREAFQDTVATSTWGVIWRAFRLMCHLFRSRVTVPEHMNPHANLGHLLAYRVIHPLVNYLSSASPYLPDVTFTQAESCAAATADLLWQKVILTLAELPSSVASFWWMTDPDEQDPKAQLDGRAAGILLVLSPPPFTSSTRSRNSVRASKQAAKQQRRLRQRRPLPAAHEGSSDSSSSGDDDDEAAARVRWQRVNCLAAYETVQASSALDREYWGAEDPAALPCANAAAQCAADALLGFQRSKDAFDGWLQSVVHSEQQQEPQHLQQQMQYFAASCRENAQTCFQLLQLQAHDQDWEEDMEECLHASPRPSSSVGTNMTLSGCSSDCEAYEGDEGSETWDGEQERGQSGWRQSVTQAAGGLQGSLKCQEQQQQQQHVHLYDWGVDRAWQVPRAALLHRRQLMLNRVLALHQHAMQQLKQERQARAAVAAAAAAASITGGPQQDQGRLLQGPGVLEAAAGSAAGGGCPQQRSSSSGADLLLLSLRVQDPVESPSGGSLVPPAPDLLRHLTVDVSGTPMAEQTVVRALLHAATASSDKQQQALDALLGVSRLTSQQDAEGMSVRTVWDQVEEDEAAGVSTRQLLWEVLGQVKPSACQWYEAATRHHHQQLLQQPEDLAPDQEPAAATSVSPALWSTLTHSLASDLLLVPPSIRDMIGNDWAAGAGRLGGAGVSSSSSSGSAAAARMLAVQYARAARRQYAQGYQPSALVSQLLVLQIMAEGQDMLTELRQDAAAQIDVALAIHTAAAAAGMMPTSALDDSRLQYWAGEHSWAAERRAGNAPCDSCSSSSFQPTLQQLAAQAGAGRAAPDHVLPWLQLLSRHHALFAEMDPKGSCERLKLEYVEFENTLGQTWRCGALANTLVSFGLRLSPLLAGIRTWFDEEFKDLSAPPATDKLLTPCSSLLEQVWTPPAQQSSPQQQQQPQGMLPDVQHSMASVADWLHAERLAKVHPSSWQQHLAEHLLSSSGGGGGGSSSTGPAGRSTKADSKLVEMLADLTCDWCSNLLPGQEGAGAAEPSSSNGGLLYGCISCGAAQYCSRECSNAAKEVHNNNCWRLQALVRDPLCWQQAAYQQSASSGRSRSIWDLSAVDHQHEQQQEVAA